MSLRMSPPRVFPETTGAAKPPMGAAGSADTYRQTGFVLGNEVDAILRGLEVEGAAAEASAGAKFRTPRMVAAMGLWSRAWLARQSALHAVQWGAYSSALPLLRSAVDYQCAEIALLGDDQPEWQAYLDDGGIALAPEQHATEFKLHAFRSGSVMAAHPVLGEAYRVLTDLSMPHFGTTLLVTASESDPSRVAMTFGDRDFQLGMAELCVGFAASVGSAQLETLLDNADVFALDGTDVLEAAVSGLKTLVSRPDRCRVELIEVDGISRYLVHNFRRAPGGAPKRVLL
ncbi:hypothetical protein AYO38_04010 [bacterium SCGC AG-212-C10]|nr:hypothetical protein AYO38_04010 [bacterium SCGC AG-212-C10]